jgi:mannitol/fructose-specific phosphotransferase system IIA component (Ntr-type)
MALSELLQRGAVIRRLGGRGVEEALGEMIDGLILAGCLGADERERILIHLLKREAISSTGLGDEIAIPHVKVPKLPDFVGAFGYSVNGVDFGAADGRPVRYLFLLLSPADDPYGHLRLLGTIATLIRRDGFLESLAAAQKEEDVLARIAAAEAAAFKDD